MSSEMEQIEARLAAYIDGVLPPDQQAEIEAYLAANPGHGRLISELKSIKSAVGNLPREKAPSEVMDGVQAQLERAVLLDDAGGPNAAARVNRWPQLGAIAAMLLLTAGLGVLVYQVLPQQKSAGIDYSLLPDSTKPALSDAELSDAPVILDAPASRPEPPSAAVERSFSARTTSTPSPQVGNPSVASLAAASPEPVKADTRFEVGSPDTRPYYTPWPGPPGTAATVPSASIQTTAVPTPATPPAGPRLVVVQTDDPLLARNLWAAHAASTGHAVRPGIGTPLTTSARDGTLTANGIGPGEPFLVVSDVVLPGPSTRPYAEADAARLFDATPPPTSQAATEPSSQPAAAITGDLVAVFRALPPATTQPAIPPATTPARLP